MTSNRNTLRTLLCTAALLWAACGARAATVPPEGYTNGFALQPPAADWATVSLAGGGGDTYDADTEMNALSAAGVTAQTSANANNPATQLATATWSSSGLYLQTRPTGNRAVVLMGKFSNNTGTNATHVTVSYLLTMAGNVSAEDAGRGTRVYFSLSGLANSWANLPTLNNTATSGSLLLSTNLSINWTNGGTLYLAWLDDNNNGGTDVANQIDNFTLRVTAGVPPYFMFTSVAPGSNAVYVSGTEVVASSTPVNGTLPHTVEYFVSSGTGNEVFTSAGTSTTPPYNVSLGALAVGTYNLYAVATDSTLAVTNSVTNTFFVADPISFALTSPANGASFDASVNINGAVSLSGGRAPYSVQYYLDDVPDGSPVTSTPYEHNYGQLFVGTRLLRATVTDASGWISNSATHTIQITGALGATVLPTNGTALNYGSSLVVTANVAGGSAPYTATIFVNDQPIAFSAPPFTTNLGIVAPGSYSVYVAAADSTAPTPQQAFSETNVITILPNPINVTLTAPSNGQNSVAGQALPLAATASVSSPLTIASVQFFYNGASAGTDTGAPFTGSVASPVEGAGTFFAVATDSLGRTSTSAVNTVNFVVDPLANNNFANRFTLSTPATVLANNTGATTEGGETTFQFGGGQFFTWGATLWWRWTAPVSGSVTIDTFGSAINTVLSVYTGAAVNGTLVTRNDNAPGSLASLVTFNAVGGTEYQIQVGGNGGGFGGGQPDQGAIQLNLSMPPTVTITNPATGNTFLVGTDFSVGVVAAAPAGTVTNVSLYSGTALVGSLNAAPYTFVVSNAPVGSNFLYAVARDSIGQAGTSAVVRVLVANIGITITSPVEDSIFNPLAPITLSVFPALPSGAITNVEFYVNGVFLGRDSTAPFSIVWTNAFGGSHRLTAIGRDDSGNTYAAVPVNFGVLMNLVAANSVWRYFDQGQDLGTNWILPSYDDSAWDSGPAELGYGDGDEATEVNGGPEGARYPTTYFRRAFVATNIAALTSLTLGIEYDDAAAVYLNGQEILRTPNLPPNATYNTYSTGASVEDTILNINLTPSVLLEGTNVLAVEIHQQAPDSSDVSFNFAMLGVPTIIKNQSPLISLTTPTNGQYFLAPASVTLSAEASDSDGSIAKVEFFANNEKLGEALTGNPYEIIWNNPPTGARVITAVATDNQGATTVSSTANIVIYDAAGTPVAAITSPANGAVMEGPTNLLITATANAITSVTNVQFLANGIPFADDATPPYSAFWASEFLSNGLQAVAFDINGVRGTSPVVSVTITIPPTNVIAPRIAAVFPPAFTTITNLTNIVVTFSERVQNVDAADLIINGLPATSVVAAPNGSNYTFHFPHPVYGNVDVAFVSGHGITDFGFPSNLPFDEQGPDAVWNYQLADQTPPRVATRTPATGSTVTNLAEIAVTFSEEVMGVDAGDLLVNGAPAFSMNGSGSNYTFGVSQPPAGTVTVSWVTNHGITDLADIPNNFNRVLAGNTWSFTLDSRTTFIQSNSVWRFSKGLAEASVPSDAWRQLAFDHSSWSNSPAPFFYGDPYTNFAAGIVGTHLTDMRSNYSTIYLRREFNVANRSIVTNLLLNAQADDGFVAWLNGVEVLRVNAPAGDIPFNGTSSGPSSEPGNAGAGYVIYTLTNNAVNHLVNGVNVLAIHALNESVGQSSDFGFNAQLYSFLPDTAVIAPRLASAEPAPGDVFYFTNVTIHFSEGVSGVDAADLLVNGVPATSVSSPSNTTYVFSFAQPPYGNVSVTWAANPGIIDFDAVPKPFDGTAPGSTLSYLLVNPSAPVVIARVPGASTTITGLTSIAVTFSEDVTGVNAADLLVNNTPATGVTANTASQYTFTFAQPAFGLVNIRFANNHGISDLEVPSSAFDYTRPANQWTYNLVNPVPSVAITAPTNNVYVLAPANVTLRATATDNDGTIALVEYFANGAKVGDATTAPYTVAWTNVPEAGYQIFAVATDNSGLSATSAPVVLNVVTSLPIALLRGPYLQSGSPTGGIVRWRTDQFSDGVVRYGTNVNNLTNVAIEATLTNNHVVQISGLQPDTKYYYTFGSSSFTLGGGTNFGGTNFWFVTSPVEGTPKPTRIWVLGDAGTANNNQRAVRDAFYNYAATNGRLADLWLMLGDNAYNNGTDAEHQAAVFDMYPTTLRNHFLWPVIGNHDAARPGDGGGLPGNVNLANFPYLDIFSLPRNGEGGGVPSGNPKYYSFNHGNIHFVGLDSMTSGRETNSAMYQWLQNDLAANTQTWVIVYFHHPPYTKGSHNSDTESDLVALRQNLVPILEAHHVDLVLAGHSHCYERSFLINGHYGLSTTFNINTMTIGGDGNGAGNGREDGGGAYMKDEAGFGTIYTVTGSAGQATGGQLNHPAHFTSLNELGSTIIDIEGDRLDMFFLNSSGVRRDYFTLKKRAPAVPLDPADVIARAATNFIELIWTDLATDEFGYYIDRSTDGVNFTRIGTNSFNTTSFLDSNLPAGVKYYYRVIAYNGGGESAGAGISALTGNNPPLLAAIPDYIADVLGVVAFTAAGVDYDLPSNQLAYALSPGAPANARLHATNGVFRWRPARADAASTNEIVVLLNDNGSPSLSATQSFTVIVRDYVELSIGQTIMEVGKASNAIVELVATAPLANLNFTVLLPTNRLATWTMQNLVPALANGTLTVTEAGLSLSFSALPGQTLSGTQQLARLSFSAPPGQSSAFVPMHFDVVNGNRALPGLEPTVLKNDGRVVLVNGQPLLEAVYVQPESRTLRLYGKPGTQYVIETSSNPANPGSWVPWQTITPTSLLELIDADEVGPDLIFFRAREVDIP